MKYLLNKNNLNKIFESYKLSIGQKVFIHHPITEDVVSFIIKKISKDNIIINVDENSPYFGMPDLTIKKTLILGTE